MAPAPVLGVVMALTMRCGGCARSRQVVGSWGPYAPPKIVSCVADGTHGRLNGYDDGDRITVTFDGPTNTPLLSRTQLVKVATFTHDSPGWGTAGSWTANDTLVLDAFVSARLLAPWEPAT